MSEFFETIKALALLPPIQTWFPLGVVTGAAFASYGLRNPRALVIVTSILIVPTATLLLNNAIGLLAMMFYVMTGFLGFCVGWIPGLVIGCLLVIFLRRKASGAKAVSPSDSLQ